MFLFQCIKYNLKTRLKGRVSLKKSFFASLLLDKIYSGEIGETDHLYLKTTQNSHLCSKLGPPQSQFRILSLKNVNLRLFFGRNGLFSHYKSCPTCPPKEFLTIPFLLKTKFGIFKASFHCFSFSRKKFLHVIKS